MSKIYLFLPDFKALVKSTSMLSENLGFNHSVYYYEDEEQIYFYKPIGSFVYCYQSQKAREVDGIKIEGLPQEEIDELKQSFDAIEVPRKLYISHIETTTSGWVTQ